jgi:hypothetical protein
MNLISTLNAGIAAAANGWAEVYIRGTSTRATVYTDFEASTSDSSGDNIDLDAYGAVEVYVNQLVDVVAKSPDGTIVRSWTDGYSSPNVEVISPAFTGHDYVSGAAAVNEPTTLQAILDLWNTNAGAPDWKVSIGGSNTTLLNAFGSLAGLVYNVKSPQFGAIGDGVTNDQSAIQAALAAAVAAGGGIVFFPAGTYLISSAMAWDMRVGMWGVGQGVSVITTNSAANSRMVTFTSGTIRNSPTVMRGLTLQSTQSNTGEIVYSSTPVNLLVDECHLGGTITSTGTLVSVSGASTLRISKSRLSVNSSAGTAIANASTARVVITDTAIVPTGSSYSGVALRLDGQSTVTSCILDFSAVFASPNYGIEMVSTDTDARVTGTVITGTSGGLPLFGIRLTGGFIFAAGNQFEVFTARYSAAGGTFPATGSYLEMGGGDQVASASPTHTIPDCVTTAGYRLSSTVPTITLPQLFYRGQRLSVVVENNSGSSWVAPNFSFFFSNDLYYGTSISAIDAGDSNAVIAEFVGMPANSSTPQWVCVHVQVGSKVS